jgi:pimeloyl-ACP methyl ester carboxylesterase
LRHEKTVARATLYWLLSLSGCAHQESAPTAQGRYRLDVMFTRYSPLSRNLEIGRRTLTPLTFAVVQRTLSAGIQGLREQPIDLTQEKFTVYVPAGAPPQAGYGLLVFVPPWPLGGVPRLWFGPLNRHRLIIISATNSGNDAKILDRRLPLALLAYENIRAQYPIDSNRVYIGGLSGGSRASLVTALAYPDVFRGVLLNAGADPIGGEAGIYIPPADLFRKFQEQMKLVYVTGDADEVNMRDDEVSRTSMKEWCVFNFEVKVVRRLGHEVLDSNSLDTALEMLDRPFALDAGKLAKCNERVQRELASKLADAEQAIASGDRNRALGKLKAIDGHYGGLAAPAILELQAKLAALH